MGIFFELELDLFAPTYFAAIFNCFFYGYVLWWDLYPR